VEPRELRFRGARLYINFEAGGWHARAILHDAALSARRVSCGDSQVIQDVS
jgi:hypothetical protein